MLSSSSGWGCLWVSSLFPSPIDSVSPAKSLGTLPATPYQCASDLKQLPSLANSPSSPPEPWPLLSQAATSGSGKCLHVSGAFWPLSFILFFLIVFIILIMCKCLCLCVSMCRCLQRSLGAGCEGGVSHLMGVLILNSGPMRDRYTLYPLSSLSSSTSTDGH